MGPNLMIRPVRPLDVASLHAFLRRAGAVELTTHTWPKVEPDRGHLSILAILGQLIPGQSTLPRMWLAKGGRRISGYAVARPRCDGRVWDVEHFHAADQGDAIELLEHLCGKAVEAGALRVFLEVPAGSAGVELGRRAGFQPYAAASLMRLPPPFKLSQDGAFSARPRLRADEHQLFQLYNAAVPAPVRAAEAMTYEEWAALHRGSKKWTPSLFGDRHQFVWELGSGLIGWMEVMYGQKSQFLELLVHPRYESMLDRMVAYALTQVSQKADVYATARDYQAPLGSGLKRAGFSPAGETEILVRQLAARVTERKLMPARVVRG